MRFNRSANHVLMAPDGDGGGAAAPAAAPAAAAPAPAAAAPAAPAAAPQASALGAGAPAPAPAGAPAAAPAPAPAAADPVFGVIPEKFRVKNDDGTPNLEASWLKVEEHRSNLERRLGAGEAPPKAAADYKLDLPAPIAEALGEDGLKKLGESAPFKAFTEQLHGLGLNQKQYAAVVAQMIERGMALRQGNEALDTQAAVADLKTTWTTQADYDKNVQAAYRAAAGYGDVGKLMARYGNDPDFIRFAAKVGADMREDTSSGGHGAAPTSQTEIESLQKDKAYWDVNDPRHAEVKAKVTAHYERMHGTGPKASGSLAIGTI